MRELIDVPVLIVGAGPVGLLMAAGLRHFGVDAKLLGVVSGPETILVTVADDNEESPVQPPPDDERPSGRGLMLVGGLADDWGVQSRDSGKTVWFTVARARRGARASVGDG